MITVSLAPQTQQCCLALYLTPTRREEGADAAPVRGADESFKKKIFITKKFVMNKFDKILSILYFLYLFLIFRFIIKRLS